MTISELIINKSIKIVAKVSQSKQMLTLNYKRELQQKLASNLMVWSLAQLRPSLFRGIIGHWIIGKVLFNLNNKINFVELKFLITQGLSCAKLNASLDLQN